MLNNNKNRFKIAAVAIVIVIGGVFWIQNKKNLKLINFDRVEVKKETITESVFGVGNLESDETYVLRAAVVSTVSHWHVHEGQDVRVGAPLVTLEGVGVLKSPISGVVTHTNYETGESVFPQSPIVSIANLKKRVLRVVLEQRAMMRVQKGMSARISFDSVRGQNFTGKVVSLVSHDGQFIVRIQPSELDERLLPGMTGEVAIEIHEIPDALVIPLAAVTERGVRVGPDLNDSTIQELELGQRQGTQVQVLSGLAVGDIVWVPKLVLP